jgi:hypothetical protein
MFIYPRNRIALLFPQALGSIFVVSYDSQGYNGIFDPASTRGKVCEEDTNPVYTCCLLYAGFLLKLEMNVIRS